MINFQIRFKKALLGKKKPKTNQKSKELSMMTSYFHRFSTFLLQYVFNQIFLNNILIHVCMITKEKDKNKDKNKSNAQ